MFTWCYVQIINPSQCIKLKHTVCHIEINNIANIVNRSITDQGKCMYCHIEKSVEALIYIQ